MKTLKELMALLPISGAKYYCSEIARLNDYDKNRLILLSNKLLNAGCNNPLPWAFGEITENVPQYSRFVILKSFYDIINNPDGILIDAELFDDNIRKKIDRIKNVLGEADTYKMLQAYARAVISGVVNMLDEGNCTAEIDKVSWELYEIDGNGIRTGRTIKNLHEDFFDFEEDAEQ